MSLQAVSHPFLFHARALRLAALLAAAALALGACSSFDRATQGMADALTLYKPEVVQGNFVSKEQVQALRPGMTRLQVRDILGTPLMASVFHANRWDYVFTMQRQRVEPQRYRLTLYFTPEGLLDRFDGDEMPSETEFVDRIGTKRNVKVPPLQATEEQLSRFAPAGDAASAAANAGVAPGADAVISASEAAPRPAGSYPPLEPPAR